MIESSFVTYVTCVEMRGGYEVYEMQVKGYPDLTSGHISYILADKKMLQEGASPRHVASSKRYQDMSTAKNKSVI